MNAGNIPNELSQLSSLQVMNFHNNSLSGKTFLTTALAMMGDCREYSK
jgi:hypothetical protein